MESALKKESGLKNRRALAIFLWAFSPILLPASLSQTRSTESQPALEVLRRAIAGKVEKGEVVSLSIAVAQKGKIVWEESFGWADKQKKRPATPYTVYPLASLSKSITATGIYLLASQQKINLEDSVSKHLRSVQLTYYNCSAKDLKVFHLLNMAGGIPHLFRYYYTDRADTVPTVKDQIRQFGFTAFSPGSVFHYSNFSFAILDQLISDASGVDFPAYMKRAIFDPIGMKHTYADKALIPGAEQIATGYYSDGSPVQPNRFEPRGGAGIYSCAHDLMLFGLFHLQNRGISKSTAFINKRLFAQLHRPRSDLLNSYYANGWGVLKTDNITTLLSNGSIAGCASTLVLVPERDIAIVCVSNSTVGNEYTDKVAFEIADILEPGYQEKVNALLAKGEEIFADKPFVFGLQYEGAWRGFIRTGETDLPMALRFDASGKVFASVGSQIEAELRNLRTSMGLFQAELFASLPLGTTTKFKHHLELELQLSASRIGGIVRAVSDENRPIFSLPYYAEFLRSSHPPALRQADVCRRETPSDAPALSGSCDDR